MEQEEKRNRKKRYKEKIEFAEKRLMEVEEWINDESEKGKLSSYKAFQESAEAIFDFIAMLIKDKGKLVEDDYKNTEKLAELGIIDRKDSEILHEVNGLRNRLVHKYNRLDDATAKESIITLTPFLKEMLTKLNKLAQK